MDGPKTKLYMAQGLGNISYPGQMNTNVYFAGNNTTVDSEDGALMSALAIANYAFGVNYPLYDNSLHETLFAFTMCNMYDNIMFPKLNGSQALTCLFKTMPELTRTATDVQPAEPLHEWKSPAFEPTIRDGRIYCRGATDNKGQLMDHVQGLAETLAKHADLPVNLIVLFEGEEEIGSPNLKPFLQQHAAELKCDLVAISDTAMVAPAIGTFTYGLRGIACLEARIHGPSIDLHSGIFGGAIANPVTAVARLTATLHDAEGRVAVKGFYDGVRDIQPWERESWAGLGDGDAEMLSLTGSPSLFGEPDARGQHAEQHEMEDIVATTPTATP